MDAWKLLGIGRDASVAEIRRAYAALLKQNRPDDDPEAFQRLLKARDVALAFAERAITEQSASARVTEIVIAPREQAPEPPSGLPPDERPYERPERDQPPFRSESVPFAGPDSAVATDDLERRLRLTLIDEGRWEDALPAWRGIVDEIGTLHLRSRRQIEGSVIDALDGLSKRVAQRPPQGHLDPAMRDLASIAVALDQEFGWAEDDRTIHETIDDPAAADTFKTVLARLRFVHRLHASGVPGRQDAHGLPVVDREDLQSFFQKETPIYAAHLARMRAAGRWLPSFDIAAFVCGIYWPLMQRLNTMLVVGLALIAAGVALDWLAQMLGRPRLGIGLALACTFGVMSFISGFFGRNARLWRMWETVVRADAEYAIDPEFRAAILKKAGRPRRWPLVVVGLLLFVGLAESGPRAIFGYKPFTALREQLSAVLPLGSGRPPPPAHSRLDLGLEVAQLEAVLRRRVATGQPSYLQDAGSDLSVSEAALVAAGRIDDYQSVLRTLLDRPLDVRLHGLIRTRIAHAEKREPAGGFKSCPEWTEPRPALVANPGAEARLRARIERPITGSLPEKIEKLKDFTLALSEFGTILLPNGRGPELVALIARLRERNPDPNVRLVLDQRIGCALTAIWRRAPAR